MVLWLRNIYFFLQKCSKSNKISQWRCTRSLDTARHFNIVLGEMKSKSINSRVGICALRKHFMLGSLQRILFLHVLISSVFHHTFIQKSHKKSLCFTCLARYLTDELYINQYTHLLTSFWSLVQQHTTSSKHSF